MPELDHVGIVVRDLQAAKRFLAEVLGLELVREGASEELALRMAFFRAGPALIEVFELDDPAAGQERLEGAPDARLDHVALRVEELAGTAASLAQAGVRFVGQQADGPLPAPVPTGATRSLFSAPGGPAGVRYQLAEPAE